MKNKIALASLLVGLVLNVQSFAEKIETTDKADETSREMKQLQENSAEVHWKIDPMSNKIHVKINKAKNEMPESLQITLYDSKGNKYPMTLKATDPWVESGGSPVSPHAYFSGTLLQAGQAYTGLEVKFPLGSSKTP